MPAVSVSRPSSPSQWRGDVASPKLDSGKTDGSPDKLNFLIMDLLPLTILRCILKILMTVIDVLIQILAPMDVVLLAYRKFLMRGGGWTFLAMKDAIMFLALLLYPYLLALRRRAHHPRPVTMISMRLLMSMRTWEGPEGKVTM